MLLLIHTPHEIHSATWFAEQLTRSQVVVRVLSTQSIDTPVDNSLFESVTAVVPLISPTSADDTLFAQLCLDARQRDLQILPIVVQPIDQEPWFLSQLQFIDATINRESALQNARSKLRQNIPEHTFGIGRDAYLQRATLKSENTVAAYRRSIELFLDFLGDRTRRGRLPIHSAVPAVPDDLALSALSANDAPIFLHFAEWLLSSGTERPGDNRPYKVSTVELRLAGVQNWFQFMDDHGWLPPQFPLAKAKRIVRDELRGRSRRSGPPQPPDHIEEVIYYYDHQPRPAHLKKENVDPARIERWELTRLRNTALLHALAESGGRVSEVLSLDVSDFPVRYLDRNEVLRVVVTGKGGHAYQLRFLAALPAIKRYIERRGATLRASASGRAPLFVSHDPRYDGTRMSRTVAWRVVQRAARALGIKSITPHDFRHWRATQLINAGTPLDVVQDYLGHRSVETTRAYYAHTDPLRVDEAARNIGLPRPDEED